MTGLTKVFGLDRKRARAALAGDTDPRRVVEEAGGHLAVRDVSVDIQRGEFFVVMGLSGSGKSTLVRMINRLVAPTAGHVKVAGRDLEEMSAAELRQLRNNTLSMVFQSFGLLPHRTVGENAAYGLHVRGVDRRKRLERAEWALDEVGLSEWRGARPSELSGGMQQRVGLARALATDAEVLLMDEPFGALDPLIRTDMQDLLLRLQQELQRTIVFITHDLNEAMRLGDRIMVMRDGEVAQVGTAPEILESPKGDYVTQFVAGVDRSRVLTAGMIIRDPLLTAQITDTPDAVLRRLENVEANGVYVLDGDGVVLGVGRDDLLAKAVREGSTSLEGCLVNEYELVSQDRPIVELCRRVGQYSVPVGVTDSDGRLLGVVPRAALLAAMASPVNDQVEKEQVRHV